MGVRRLIDMLFAATAFPLALPVMAVIAGAIRLADGAPVLYRQVRMTKGGRRFSVIKFRTMTDARDRQGRLLPDAMRTTRIGGFLRRSRLDELPQLWNILTGTMSLIGPPPSAARDHRGSRRAGTAAVRGQTRPDGLGTGQRQHAAG